MHPNHTPRAVLGAFLALVALALLFGIVRCGASSDREGAKALAAKAASYKGFAGRAPVTTTTTEAPVTTTEAPSGASPARSDPQPTVPPSERPQSFTADGDDAEAWHCLAVLESGNGTASRNLYGISDSRASGMSAGEQLAYARRIRDRTGGYLEGWPNTGPKCGLG